MKADTYALQVLLWTLSGWVNRHQQTVIAYLAEENRILMEQIKGRRLPLTDEQRRRLAGKGKRLVEAEDPGPTGAQGRPALLRRARLALRCPGRRDRHTIPSHSTMGPIGRHGNSPPRQPEPQLPLFPR